MIKSHKTFNPSNGKLLETYPVFSESKLNNLLSTLKAEQNKWRAVPIDERIKTVKTIGQILLKNIDQYAQLITDEMGKTLAESKAEIKKSSFLCDYYAENGKAFLTPEKIDYHGLNAERIFEPLGVIYSITPWNFPFWQVFRVAIPNLLLGNALVLKHAENVIGSGYALESIIETATAPLGCKVFKNVVIDLNLSNYIICHDAVAAVTLTGSNRAGSVVASQAGKACKKSVMELGGSDPYIIRSDVDLDEIVKHITSVRMSNAGQVCISPKRLIVNESIKDAFEQAIVREVQKIVLGNPNDPLVTMGPMARKDLRDTLHKQVQKSLQEGASLLAGGKVIDNEHGCFYTPTVLTDVTENMTAFKEELFGPVIAITISTSDEEAIALANKSPFGLGSGIFTKDIKWAQRIARHEIHAGMCFINTCVSSHPALPFGGVKQSGYGRECSKEALHELANIKTVLIGS